MKNLIIALLLAITSQFGHAALHPSAVQLTQFNPAGDDNSVTVYFELISGNPSYLFAFDGSSKTPTQWTVGSGLAVSGGVLNCTVTGASSKTPSLQSRSLNSAFLISASRPAYVEYFVKITTTSTIAGGQEGEVYLDIADNSGMSTNLETIGVVSNGQAVSLAVALQVVQPLTMQLGGYIPPNKYVRLRTNNVTGTPTYTYRIGREVLE